MMTAASEFDASHRLPLQRQVIYRVARRYPGALGMDQGFPVMEKQAVSEYVLREFVCTECGHKVVVNPQLPPDYEPTICCECYDRVVRPKMDVMDRKIAIEMQKLARLLGLWKA
jgi:hypothetical protein